MVRIVIFRILRYINKTIKVMMSTESLYIAEQEYSKFQEIVNTKEYLTQEEYDFCFAYDKTIKEDMFYIGDYSKLGDFLNLKVYSEQEHHEYTQMVERGF